DDLALVEDQVAGGLALAGAGHEFLARLAVRLDLAGVDVDGADFRLLAVGAGPQRQVVQLLGRDAVARRQAGLAYPELLAVGEIQRPAVLLADQKRLAVENAGQVQVVGAARLPNRAAVAEVKAVDR